MGAVARDRGAGKPCSHLTVASADGRIYHCVAQGCGREMNVTERPQPQIRPKPARQLEMAL
jgi:hypothetical protein